MSNNRDELKEDINNCFKLIAKIDNKYDAKYDDLKTRHSDYVSDIKLLTKGLETMAVSLETQTKQFEKHSNEEIDNYKGILESQNETKKFIAELKSSIDTEIAQNQTRDTKLKEHGEDIATMKATQAKFLKYFAYFAGVGSTIVFLLESGIVVVKIGG